MEERREGFRELETRVRRLEVVYESGRLSSEARLQSIERILDRISKALETLLARAPFVLGGIGLLYVITIWIGIEGWRKP